MTAWDWQLVEEDFEKVETSLEKVRAELLALYGGATYVNPEGQLAAALRETVTKANEALALLDDIARQGSTP